MWDAVLDDYELSPDEVEVLRLACEALDAADRARLELVDGLVVQGRYGPRAHPAVAISRDQAALAARLLKQLGLNDIPTPANRRHRAPDRKAR